MKFVLGGVPLHCPKGASLVVRPRRKAPVRTTGGNGIIMEISRNSPAGRERESWGSNDFQSAPLLTAGEEHHPVGRFPFPDVAPLEAFLVPATTQSCGLLGRLATGALTAQTTKQRNGPGPTLRFRQPSLWGARGSRNPAGQTVPLFWRLSGWVLSRRAELPPPLPQPHPWLLAIRGWVGSGLRWPRASEGTGGQQGKQGQHREDMSGEMMTRGTRCPHLGFLTSPPLWSLFPTQGPPWSPKGTLFLLPSQDSFLRNK